MTDKRFPFPTLPTGWFCVGLSSDVRRGQAVRRRYFGRELVLFRTASGRAHLLDAYCPHLGAHLGEHGTVMGEEIRCGFHGFRFDGQGTCTATAYGSRPPARAALRCWEVDEVDGLLLAWHDALGREPDWRVPRLPREGWTDLRCRDLRLRSHPQETSENSVDFGHFTIVHGFARAWVTSEVTTDGPVLRTSYGVDRKLDFLGMPGRTFAASFDVAVHGLGYSLVEGVVPAVGLRMRHVVMSTPVDGENIHMRLCSAIGTRPFGPLTLVARALVNFALQHEVSRDAPIWESKVYVDRPALAKGDGPIGAYRRWARQFYPEPADLAAAAE